MLNNYDGKFRDQRWLVAHNAWNTEIAPNQFKTVTELLDYGVRGLALDVYGDDEKSLHLQHGHGNIASRTIWKKILEELDAWLKKNTDQIVTLFFESYLTGPTDASPTTALNSLHDSLKRVTGFVPNRIPQVQAIVSKTLKQLVKDNQRLFAFIEKEPDEGFQMLFPSMWEQIHENVYGNPSLKIPTWVNMRPGSFPTPVGKELTFMNHFGEAPTGSEWDRNEDSLIKKHAEAFVFAFGGRYPNFISLDYINWDSTRRGPIRAIEDLTTRKDFTSVTTFHWQQSNDFDDLYIDINDTKKITDFSVNHSPEKGIEKLVPLRGNGVGITEIELVNMPGRGIVDIRYRKGGAAWSNWVTGYANKGGNNKPANLAKHTINGDLFGICCRTQEGCGVTDFAAAFRK